MTAMAIDESRLRDLFEEALLKVLDQRREWFSELFTEALENTAPVQAIKEGERTAYVSREEVFRLLGA